jgi:RNA polymerase primary sigma factor
MIELYINDIKKYPPLKREEEERLIALAKAGDRASYEKVINSNLRFVFQIAKSYQDRGVDLEDLIAEGNTGLIKAFDRFDQTKGIKFISYAV